MEALALTRATRHPPIPPLVPADAETTKTPARHQATVFWEPRATPPSEEEPRGNEGEEGQIIFLGCQQGHPRNSWLASQTGGLDGILPEWRYEERSGVRGKWGLYRRDFFFRCHGNEKSSDTVCHDGYNNSSRFKPVLCVSSPAISKIHVCYMYSCYHLRQYTEHHGNAKSSSDGNHVLSLDSEKTLLIEIHTGSILNSDVNTLFFHPRSGPPKRPKEI